MFFFWYISRLSYMVMLGTYMLLKCQAFEMFQRSKRLYVFQHFSHKSPPLPGFPSIYLDITSRVKIYSEKCTGLYRLNCMSLLFISHWITSLKMFVSLAYQEKESTHFLGYFSSPTVCIRPMIFYVYKHKATPGYKSTMLLSYHCLFHCPTIGHISISLFFPECGQLTT